MTISEPTTVLTDYLLALLALWWGTALWRDGICRGQRAPRLFAACFLVTALAAVLGGTAHGFIDALARESLEHIWRLTTIGLGVAGYLLLAGAAVASLGGAPRRVVLGLGALKLAAYVVWTARHHEFYWVILEYGSSMLVVAALMARLAARSDRADRTNRTNRASWGAARWVLGGIALSALGGGIQAAGLAPHPHFNHNDLYHVVQMVALYVFYRGGLELDDGEA